MTYFILIISVLLIGLLVQIVSNFKVSGIKLLLAFSGAYLFALSIFHLLPEIYINQNKNIGIFILLGFILQIILEFFSQGIEHGHGSLSNKNIPITMMISLLIHAYLEGIPLGGIKYNTHIHENLQNSLLTGITLHKIPVTIVLMSLFMEAKISKIKSFILIFIFAIITPLGAITSDLVQEIDKYQKEIMAIIIGIFLHISTTILFESSEGHKFNIQKLLAIIVGSILGWII